MDIVFTASFLGFPTPPALTCSTMNVGSLAAGNYVVNLFLLDTTVPDPIPRHVAIGALVVGVALTSIPTLSSVGLVALTLFLASAGMWLRRRR
jgi:hypothetical protein